MIAMFMGAQDEINVDFPRAYKSLFITNALDGSEDHLISDKLFELVGVKIKKFREKLMMEESPSTLDELIKTITAPKGIRRGRNVEGQIEGEELMDCSGDEINSDDEDEDTDKDENDGEIKLTKEKSTSVLNLTNLSNDPDVNADAEFLNTFQILLETQTTSRLFIPYLSQLKVINQKARRSIKNRIERARVKTQAEQNETLANDNVDIDIDEDEDRDEEEPIFVVNDENKTTLPKVGEYWKIKNGTVYLYAIIAGLDPLSVNYFEPTVKKELHCLNDMVFDVYAEDLKEKLESPEMIQKGRRKYYRFE